MEGDGPLNGSPKDLRTILLADDPVAADGALARLLGLRPARIRYITEAGRFLGNITGERISYLS